MLKLSFPAMACALAFLIPAAGTAQVLPPPVRLSSAIWVWIGPYGPPTKENGGFRMNMGFVVGTESVAVVDSGYTDDMAAQMLDAIRAISRKPVRYVINTNSQPHRFMGNATFEEAGAETIAAAEAAERMGRDAALFREAVEQTLAKPKGSVRIPRAPRRLISEGTNLTLDLGDVALEVAHAGTTHTKGSLIVSVRPDNVTFAGDILYGGRLPAILSDGNITGWLTAYRRLGRLAEGTFVPGHGQPAPLRAFDHSTQGYLSALKRHMDQEVKAGTSIDNAVNRFDSRPWQSLENFSDLARRNAYNAFLESEADF